MQTVLTAYAEQGIKLAIESKRVKHINFRIKSIDEAPFTSLLSVSYPMRMPQHLLMQSLEHRLAWAIDCQQKQRKLKQLKPKKPAYINDVKDLANLTLESNIYFEGQKMTVQALFERHFVNSDFSKTDIPRTLTSLYKAWLTQFIQNRQAFWQDKVGKSANSITPYTMKTRWGSCSTQAKTIRLSVWLAQFPPDCADYVLVHELCHLIEPNHSARFWSQVARVMPDYQLWHQQLKFGEL